MLLEKDSLAFTYCQVLIIYIKSTTNQMELFYENGTNEIVNSLALDIEKSKKVFQRTGEIVKIKVSIKEGLGA
jgi:maleate cis-trans isomerase